MVFFIAGFAPLTLVDIRRAAVVGDEAPAYI
jgi:hypothetical protein